MDALTKFKFLRKGKSRDRVFLYCKLCGFDEKLQQSSTASCIKGPTNPFRGQPFITLLPQKKASKPTSNCSRKTDLILIYCPFFIYLSIMSSRLPQAPPPPLLPIAPAVKSSSEVCLATRAYD